nr:MAG TPA: Cbb3-type cytochrome c oxidase subunit [Caudoviricetes sp.]
MRYLYVTYTFFFVCFYTVLYFLLSKKKSHKHKHLWDFPLFSATS